MALDDIRLPLQTAAAVLLAYACMRWRDLPEIAWGAFSALFVVRASVEGTIGEATGRILGALIGIALGVSLVLLSRFAELAPAWGIACGVGLAGYISIRWPMLSYSLVTVTILTVTPDSDIVAGAMQKTIAIAIGSASGILAAAAVLPLSAHRNVCINLAASVEAYGDLLAQWAAAFGRGGRRPRLYSKTAMEQARRRARDMSSQARTFPLDILYRHTLVYQLHDRVERLWRTAGLMERAGSLPLSDRVRGQLGPALEKVAAAAGAQIDGLAQALRRDGRAAMPGRQRTPLQRLDEIIEAAARRQSLDAADREAIEVIRWAWWEVAQELDSLADHLDSQRARARRPGKGR
ncbi:FUSC family protein [Bordetella petrii]|nr:FUSC family protein [Bordetella petrii]